MPIARGSCLCTGLKQDIFCFLLANLVTESPEKEVPGSNFLPAVHCDALRGILVSTSNVISWSSLPDLQELLFAGQPVIIVTLGGSITLGHGTYDSADSWPSRFFTWFSQAFPHPDHQFLNQAVPATTSR